MKYEVTYTLTRTASFDVEIEADSADEARRIAEGYADEYEGGCDWDNVVLNGILDLDSDCGWDTSVTDITVE